VTAGTDFQAVVNRGPGGSLTGAARSTRMPPTVMTEVVLMVLMMNLPSLRLSVMVELPV
jgi:hypothetical protein